MTTTPGAGLGWAPAACALPTEEQPLRIAEFDTLFSRHVQQVRREGTTRLLLALSSGPEVAATAAALAVRESRCCSFFTFDLRITDSALTLVVSTSDAHAGVLAALADRAASLSGRCDRAADR
ncbi:MAG TPA: hypothetical protein VF557_00150 [Jatrophihabitans sp.]|jgi:hypothetical protein|uniref:hypothetical protein n=1 Tax=Jatrophihabitans sp. TaxID=1932789 RepID=UPI002F1AAC0C